METRANYIAVGFFTLAAIVVAFALIYWFGRYGEEENLVPVDVRIQGSVSGLGAGSLVQFNGINVGRVTKLSLDPDDPRFVIVRTRVNASTPIRSDTRATIGIRGLSGGAFVQLEGGTPNAASLLGGDMTSTGIPSIEGDPAALSDLLARVNSIAVRTEQVMNTLESFVETNNETVSNTFKNAETFSKALAENSDGVAKFLSSAGGVAKSLEQLSAKLDGSVTQAEKILKAVDADSISRTVQNVETFSKSLSDQRDAITTLVATINNTATKLDGFTGNLNKTLTKVDGVVDAVDPARVSSAVASLDASAKQASELLGSVDPATLKTVINDVSTTTALARGIAENIDKQLVKTLVADLSTASSSMTKLLDAVDPSRVSSAVESLDTSAKRASELLASVDPATVKTVMDDVSATTALARGIAESVDQQAVKSLITELSSASTSVTKLLDAIDTEQVNGAVQNFSKAAEGAQTVVTDVSKLTAPLGARAEDVEKIISDTSELAARLNNSSKKVDAVIAKIDEFVGSGDNGGLVSEARQTMATFRSAARNFNTQISSVARSINSFTNRGLADTQTFIRDASRSLNQIDRVMRNLQNNPSSLITGAGGSRVRESSGQRPRR